MLLYAGLAISLATPPKLRILWETYPAFDGMPDLIRTTYFPGRYRFEKNGMPININKYVAMWLYNPSTPGTGHIAFVKLIKRPDQILGIDYKGYVRVINGKCFYQEGKIDAFDFPVPHGLVIFISQDTFDIIK